MTLTFKRYGSTDIIDELELDETKSSIIDKLNEPTRLSAILTTTTAPQIALGNYTTYNGTRYYVTKEPTVRKEHSQLYTVEVDLERSLGLARITILANPVDHRTTFDYTGTATEHLQLIVDCLNAKYEEVGLKWTRGAVHCKDTIKHVKYDGATVLGALQQIRETYETDIFADGETLSLGQTDDKTTALPLAYGKGKGLLSGLERHKHTDDTVPTRLYVTGTKRNMTTGRLTLERDVVLAIDPKSGTIERDTGGMTIKPDGRTRYRTDKAGQYIAEWSPTEQFVQWGHRFPTEATYTNEEIYPSHVSTIRSVTKVKDHFEVNSDFDYDKFRIEGEQMQVVFQSGNLAGRDFDAKYYPSTGRLAIAPKEEDDTTLPNDTLCPKVGDQYIVTGIKLPNAYIREAERNLTDEALRHLIKLQETRYSYKADIDPVYLHNNHDTIAPQLAVGRYVHLTDPQITIGDPYVRIVGKRTYLDRPYTPEIELSNEVEPPSELTRVLNELDRQDNGLTSVLDRIRLDTVRADSLARRVGTAEEALADKASTADVQQSARDAIAEAIKRAGEMDREIKVGGRNLFRKEYFIGNLASNYEIPFDALQPREGANTYTLSLDYKISPEDKAASPRISCMYPYGDDRVFLWDSNIVRDGEWHHKEYTFKLDIDPSKYPIYGWFTDYSDANGRTIDMVAVRNIKLERGTVATDWTPAPEDVAESVTSLESKLLDPQQGKISKLEKLLGKHSESFDALATHPLTVDEAGYWKIWSVKDSKYLTTQYKSRGDKGDKGEDAGRYLGRAKRIHPDLIGNYLLETDTKFKWLTAKEGDYVYLVGDAPNRGGDKDTYYIVREHKSKTDWEVYNIKGHTPRLTLDEQFHLLADGEMVSEISLRGKDGHTPGIRWHGTSLVIDNQPPVDLRGEAGHSPSTEEVLKDKLFQEMLRRRVQQQVVPVSDELEQKLETTKSSFEDSLQRVNTWRENFASSVSQEFAAANNNITSLQEVALTTQQREDLGYLTSALRLKMAGGEGGKKTLEGLALQRYIALSGDNQKVTAYLASDALGAVLKAGITDFGTLNEREQVEITHQGTGHFGNLYFTGDQIDFRTAMDANPYLSIGAWDMEPIDRFVKTTRVDDTPVSVYSLELSSKRKVYEQTVSVANDGTRLTVHIDKLTCDCVLGSYAQLTLDGHLLTTWRGDVRDNDKGLDSGDFGLVDVPYRGENLSYERVVSAGTHTLRLEVVDKSRGGLALDGLTVRRYYDSGRRQSLLTKNGMRFFASADRYFDVDYRSQIITGYKPIPGLDGELPVYEKNPYIVRIKGGMQVDELDMPGVPLCGASFNANGTQIKAFGKYVNQRGTNRAQAVYYDSGRFFRVYHSIGHTNYLPTVQVIDSTDNDINWNLTARIYAVNANDFAVRIITNGDNPIKHAFSFVAFKTM